VFQECARALNLNSPLNTVDYVEFLIDRSGVPGLSALLATGRWATRQVGQRFFCVVAPGRVCEIEPTKPIPRKLFVLLVAQGINAWTFRVA
jgi:hypothetical protein